MKLNPNRSFSFSIVSSLGLFALVALLASAPGTVTASIDVFEFSSEDKRDAFQDLTRELRCPKCQNQDINDSDAPIAKDMRAQVHRLVEEGKSHDEVVDFMIERFGEFVTYKPKVSQETYLLWYGPWVFIGIGVVAAILLAKKRGKVNTASALSESTIGGLNSSSSSTKTDADHDSDSHLSSNTKPRSTSERAADILKKYSDE